MILLEDKNNKDGKHELKHEYWISKGIEVIREYRLPVGDYVLSNRKIEDVIARKNKRGIPIKQMDLLGTYKVAVDTKNSIQELCGNVCGAQHERFRDECILASNNGIRLVILVENDVEKVLMTKQIINPVIHNLEDLHKWVNPRLFVRRGGRRLYPNATRGITLMKACITMQKKYGVEFQFCTSKESGARVLEILSEGRHE